MQIQINEKISLLIEETCDAADRFIKTVEETGKWYKRVEEV